MTTKPTHASWHETALMIAVETHVTAWLSFRHPLEQGIQPGLRLVNVLKHASLMSVLNMRLRNSTRQRATSMNPFT